MTLQSTNEDVAAKAVLFCPRCGYRGEWTEWCPGDDEHTLECPSCGTTVG
jgi:DNA-directed RNA polymerase subunit RPC12/RpoP